MTQEASWPPPQRAHAMPLPPYQPEQWRFEPRFEDPPTHAQSVQWMLEARTFNAPHLQESERNYPKYLALANKAVGQNHLPALVALADVHLHGQGVAPNPDRGLEMLDYAAWRGSASAFTKLGVWAMRGWKMAPDTEHAHALWQHAATLGCAKAQLLLGAEIVGGFDDQALAGARLVQTGPMALAQRLLKCALAQGQGDAALHLGQLAYPAAWAAQVRAAKLPLASEAQARAMAPAAPLSNQDIGYAVAAPLWQLGIALGSADCAEALEAYFETAISADKSRCARYGLLAAALRRNPDLRFPNLDKILPLPPARLPKWDGDIQKLIDAAKALVPAPVVKPTPGAQRTGRAHIPAGWVLPAHPVPLQTESLSLRTDVMAQYESTPARFSGYWLAQLLDPQTERHAAWDSAQVPQRYALGESFESQRQSVGPGAGRVMWHYLGVPVKQAAAAERPEVTQGIARYIRIPEPLQRCLGNTACTHTGIWYGQVDSAHRHAKTYNHWSQQAYVEQGAAFPKPQDRHLDIKPAEVRWLWLGQANEATSPHYDTISLDEA